MAQVLVYEYLVYRVSVRSNTTQIQTDHYTVRRSIGELCIVSRVLYRPEKYFPRATINSRGLWFIAFIGVHFLDDVQLELESIKSKRGTFNTD